MESLRESGVSEEEKNKGATKEADDRRWYVIHTYSGYENKVKQNLEHRIDSMEMHDQIFRVIVPTEEEIETIYLEGWKLGLKAVAVYRDGSKLSQPLNTASDEEDGTPVVSFTAGSNADGYYAISGNTVTLTAAGAAFVNGGGTFPAISLTATDSGTPALLSASITSAVTSSRRTKRGSLRRCAF